MSSASNELIVCWREEESHNLHIRNKNTRNVVLEAQEVIQGKEGSSSLEFQKRLSGEVEGLSRQLMRAGCEKWNSGIIMAGQQ